MIGKCKIIAVTGYMGSGSSAVIDLLKEYDTVKVVPQIGRTYEHIPFYYRGGLFDLYNAFKHGNTPMGSDATINRFYDSMRILNDNNFYWCGSYKKLFGNKFMDINKELINSISSPFHATNVNHFIGTNYSLLRLLEQIGAKLLLKRKIRNPGLKVKFDNNSSYIGLPTNEELLIAAKTYTSNYFELFTYSDDGVFVFDHVILPQQVEEFGECFNDNVKVVIVRRDPRDIFLLNKYIWYTPPLGHGRPYFPTDAKKFANLWKRMVPLTTKTDNCVVVQFESLVYDYNNTVAEIEKQLNVDSKLHTRIKENFNPNKSIENTQIFNVNEEWKEEIKELSIILKDYLYDFPINRKPEKKKMFA